MLFLPPLVILIHADCEVEIPFGLLQVKQCDVIPKRRSDAGQSISLAE